MYICENCGNSEKFIGYAQEKGKAFIYQNNSGQGLDLEHALGNRLKSNDSYTECISENLSWAYFLSDKDWKSSFKIKKCYYCNSKKISWQ